MKITEVVIKMNLPTFYEKKYWSIHEVSKLKLYSRMSRKHIFTGWKTEELWVNSETGEQRGVERRETEFRMQPRIRDKYNGAYTG